MNDLETLKAMFDRRGIDYDVCSNGAISVYGGYDGFFSVFTFDDEGSLISVDAYE